MKSLEIQDILKALPHRYPFLLVDKILDIQLNESIKALKNVTINEPFFQGHFPEEPVMPGVIIIEAIAQAIAILACKSMGVKLGEDGLYYLVGIDNTRFKRIVKPGDQLILEAQLIQTKKAMQKYTTTAKVNDEIVCSAEIMGAYREIDS